MTASALVKTFPVFDFETYLDLEVRSTNKNEFYYGHIYVMAGGTNRHHLLCAASLFQLSKLLSKRNCYVLPGEAKVETPNAAAVFYSDVSVHCDQKLPLEALTTKSPILVVEVLSPTTRNYDQTTKRKEYFRIPSLRHYLLLDSEAISAMLYTRDPDQTWPKDPLTFTDPKATVPLTALKISLNLKDLYRQTGLL